MKKVSKEQPRIDLSRIDLALYYTIDEAAHVLSKRSGKTISTDYVRSLARYKIFHPLRVRPRFHLYPKAEIDAYTVEARGVKSAAAAKAKADKNG